MKIEVIKKSHYSFEYILTRKDKSVEQIELNTKTYLVHDICHFATESILQYNKGFWGMLAQGHSFSELVGKENTLTEELRFVERIVGPIQSVYLEYLPKQNFEESVKHLNFSISETDLMKILDRIKLILSDWQKLPINDQLTLEWTMR